VKLTNQTALYPGTDSNPSHPKYEADLPTATPLLQFHLCMIKLKSHKRQMFLTVRGIFESRSEFLATDSEVPGSIPGATRLSEK
jgi:hypothetical protein